MSTWLSPLSDDAMRDDQRRAMARACRKLDLAPELAPSWMRVAAHAPHVLQDAAAHIAAHILSDGELTAAFKLTLSVVVAHEAGARTLIDFFAEQARARGVDDEALIAALAIAATAVSYNVYYRFRGLSGRRDEFASFHAGLRASRLVSPPGGKAHAEILSVVVSSGRGCASCVASHVDAARELGVSAAQIDEAVRCAAVVEAIASFLRGSPLP